MYRTQNFSFCKILLKYDHASLSLCYKNRMCNYDIDNMACKAEIFCYLDFYSRSVLTPVLHRRFFLGPER